MSLEAIDKLWQDNPQSDPSSSMELAKWSAPPRLEHMHAEGMA
jgi:hypothetical protein